MKADRPRRRALLVASVGVATVSYALAGCGKSHPPGNLAQPQPAESVTPVAGNLVAEPVRPVVDAGKPPAPR